MIGNYKVLIVGMGKRGLHHATAFHANPRFKVAGICDIDKARLEAAAPKIGNPKIGTDAAALMLSHLIDYTCWFNEYADAGWAMAQAAGRGKLSDLHTSPDYIAGVVHFTNGVRGVYDCGAGAPDVPEVPYWWRKCRIGAQGSEGFAEVMTGGGWRAVTRSGGYQTGEGGMNYDYDMPPYVQEMADWLGDEQRPHP